MNTRLALSLCVTAAAVLAADLAGVSSAMAQPDEPVLEEIVVTARRREETFQDVPVTITAFSEEDIRSAGIERPQDFISLTPNVTLVETQNQGTSFITVRGISQARNSEPSVAVVVDGVLMSNPAQFTQELFDVQQIEVLKGAQGAVYGRNAIGGAILITTEEPAEQNEARVRLGYDSGPGAKMQIMGNGPLGDSDTLSYHAALSYYDTDGYIDNPFLGEEADPFQDISTRLRLIWEPNDRLTTDARLYYSEIDTQALYFNIVADPFDPTDFGDVNDTSLPVRVNNPGINERELGQLSFKLDYETNAGTFTSITSFDSVEEILTGDQFDFLPIEESFFFPIFGFDWAQSQFLDVDTWSQDLRFTSSADQRLRWIAGAYMIGTDRYISTGNIRDSGQGAFPVFREPRGMFPFTPTPEFPESYQLTFLADGQDNFAWALYGELAYDINERTELSFALRYDEDTREQTTLTPQPFLVLEGQTGEVREETWDELQPRLTLRYQPSDNLTLFGGYSKGFRSGGFNQTGVGTAGPAAGFPGIKDLFDAEVAETLEFGLKSRLGDRVNLNFSVFDTEAEGSYYFVFLAGSSTQNLGSLGEVDYQGFEFDVTAGLGEYLDLFFGYGYTDSEIKADENAAYIGNQAPLVSEDTINVGLQYRRPLAGTGLEFFVRTDYNRAGDTWWEPNNVTVRDPVNLLDWRIGLEGDTWSLTGWQRNFNDVRYNAEFSPGGFVFKGKPRTWGVEFTKAF